MRASGPRTHGSNPRDRTRCTRDRTLGIEPRARTRCARAGCHGTWRMLGRPAVASPTGVGSNLIVLLSYWVTNQLRTHGTASDATRSRRPRVARTASAVRVRRATLDCKVVGGPHGESQRRLLTTGECRPRAPHELESIAPVTDHRSPITHRTVVVARSHKTAAE